MAVLRLITCKVGPGVKPGDQVRVKQGTCVLFTGNGPAHQLGWYCGNGLVVVGDVDEAVKAAKAILKTFNSGGE